jgi:hypothetical protein
MKHLFFTLFFLGFMSCSQKNTEATFSNVPGEDSNFGLLLGQGFNPIDSSIKGHCVELGKLSTQSGNETGQTSEYRLLEITSETGLRESLNVSASASFGGVLGKANARANFSQSVNKNNQSRYLLAHVRVANQLELSQSFRYSDSAIKLIKQNDSNSFVKSCGSEFVYGRRTGGEFFAVFEFAFSSSQEDRAFSTAVSASGAGWKGAINVNSELAKFGKFSNTQVKMYKIGGASNLPEVSSISDFAGKFESMVSQPNFSSVTLELLTKPYDGVEPLDLKPNMELFIRQQYTMEQLGQNRDNAKELMNSIRYVKSNLSIYENPETSNLDKKESDLISYINATNNSAVNCFEDIFNGCEVPKTPFPEVNLPKRKAGILCQEKTFSICEIPQEIGECLAYKTEKKVVCENQN